MLVVITGGTGFIGRELVVRHVKLGDTVRVLSRSARDGTDFPDAVQLCLGDVNGDREALAEFCAGADILYHCAGETRDESRMQAANVDGTRNLARAAAGSVKRWVQLSSVGVYGRRRDGVITESAELNPVDPYERSKEESEGMAREAATAGGFELSTLRPSIVFGPGMPNRSFRQMVSMVNRGLFFFVGKPGATVNFTNVYCVVEALIACGRTPETQGKTYNLSGSCTVEDFVGRIAENLGRSAPRLRLPEAPARAAARAAKMAWPGCPLTESRIDALTNRAVYSSEAIVRDLSFSAAMEKHNSVDLLVEDWRRTRAGPGN
ncbi:NAD-dependent epimerase/dehydratase family protein [Verrucomicrobiota bacterium]